MIFVLLIFVFNISISFLLSKKDNFFKTSKDKLSGEYNSYFSHIVQDYDQSIKLQKINKYKTEMIIFVLVLLVFIMINALMSYFLLKLNGSLESLNVENMFKTFFAEFVLIISTGLVLNKFNETYLNYQKITKGDFYLWVIQNGIMFIPFVTLEGGVSSELSKTNYEFLSLPIGEVSQFLVEPSKRAVSANGSIAHSPPYFKILLKNKNEYIYVLRSFFYGEEKRLIELISKYLTCEVIYNDQLK